TGSMESAWLCLLCLAGSSLVLLGTVEPALGLQPAESLPGQSREEMELVRGRGNDACGGGKGATGSPPPGLTDAIPQCEPGEPCAVRKGARIGKLCSCPRGTACNLFILKCS
ncbi:Cocaine- and amphetamine-regulated transcript protein, partial [Eudyptes schlegeli]